MTHMFDSLLIAIDGSGNPRAVQQTLDLAEQYTATVHALYVIDIVQSGPGITGRSNISSTQSILRDEGLEVLKTITASARDREIPIVTEIREGMPAREICAYANETEIDLLILSPHGRTGFSRFLHGSVTEETMNRTKRPVLTIQKGALKRESEASS